MSTKRHEPDEKTRAEVAALSSYGVPQAEIAQFLGVDPKTLRKHYRPELDESTTRANAAVGKFLYEAASGRALTTRKGATYADCIRAAMFWAKTRMQWRERTDIDLTSGGEKLPAPSVDWSKMSLEALEEIRNAISSDDDQ